MLKFFFSELRIDVFEQTPSYGFFKLVGKATFCLFVCVLFFFFYERKRGKFILSSFSQRRYNFGSCRRINSQKNCGLLQTYLKAWKNEIYWFQELVVTLVETVSSVTRGRQMTSTYLFHWGRRSCPLCCPYLEQVILIRFSWFDSVPPIRKTNYSSTTNRHQLLIEQSLTPIVNDAPNVKTCRRFVV